MEKIEIPSCWTKACEKLPDVIWCESGCFMNQTVLMLRRLICENEAEYVVSVGEWDYEMVPPKWMTTEQYNEGNGDQEYHNQDIYDVIAWMPLPEIPKKHKIMNPKPTEK